MKKIATFFCICALLLSACSRPQSKDTGKSAMAVQQTNLYMDALKASDFDAAWKFYARDFFMTHSEEGWRDYLQGVEKKRGKMQRYEVSDQQMDIRYSGTFFIVNYRVWYANSKKSSSQIVTMIEPVTGGPMQIYAHKLEFDDVQVQ
ncbi:MAG: hypothetical protein AABY83_10710 [Pseudomonadota bacterium]